MQDTDWFAPLVDSCSHAGYIERTSGLDLGLA